MRMKIFPAFAAALFMSASAATAETMIDPAIQADLAVTDWVDHIMSGGFDAKHRNLLKTAAHQMAVSSVCEGFAVDNEKAGALLAMVAEGHSEEDEDFESVQTTVIMALGALIGAGHAAHALDPDGFCADAAAERADEEAMHLIYVSD